jgi:hypothetical protein
MVNDRKLHQHYSNYSRSYTVTQTVNGCESSAGSGTAAPKTTPSVPVVTVVNNCDGTSPCLQRFYSAF